MTNSGFSTASVPPNGMMELSQATRRQARRPVATARTGFEKRGHMGFQDTKQPENNRETARSLQFYRPKSGDAPYSLNALELQKRRAALAERGVASLAQSERHQEVNPPAAAPQRARGTGFYSRVSVPLGEKVNENTRRRNRVDGGYSRTGNRSVEATRAIPARSPVTGNHCGR